LGFDFQALKQLAEELCPGDVLNLTYADEDGDKVCLKGDDDLSLMLEGNSRNPLSVFLHRPPSPFPGLGLLPAEDNTEQRDANVAGVSASKIPISTLRSCHFLQYGHLRFVDNLGNEVRFPRENMHLGFQTLDAVQKAAIANPSVAYFDISHQRADGKWDAYLWFAPPPLASGDIPQPSQNYTALVHQSVWRVIGGEDQAGIIPTGVTVPTPATLSAAERLVSLEKQLAAAKQFVRGLEREREKLVRRIQSGDARPQPSYFYTFLSKRLAWALRHGADKLALTMDCKGFVFFDELANKPEFRNLSLNHLQELMKNDIKGRFSLVRHGARYKLRATYGHSLPTVITSWTENDKRIGLKNCDDPRLEVPRSDRISHVGDATTTPAQLQNMVDFDPTYHKLKMVDDSIFDHRAETEEKVRRQIEFWFDNWNSPTSWGQRKCKDIANNQNGRVGIETLLTFNKIKGHLNKGGICLAEWTAVVAASIQKSAVVELTSSGAAVRRKLNMPAAPMIRILQSFQTQGGLDVGRDSPTLSPSSSFTIDAKAQAMERTRKQIEYYFSKANLKNDSFMNDIAKKNDGYVEIDTLMNFNKLKTIFSKASIPEPERAIMIAECVKKSTKVEVRLQRIRRRDWFNEQACSSLTKPVLSANPDVKSSSSSTTAISKEQPCSLPNKPDLSIAATAGSSAYYGKTLEVATKIRKQLEFDFGENFSTDKLLQTLATDKDGFVDIDMLVNFKLGDILKENGIVEADRAALVAASILNSAIIEIGKGGTALRQRADYPRTCVRQLEAAILGVVNPSEKLQKQLRKQIEFYFGNKNFPKDKFLQGCADSDGFVPIDTLLTFKKMEEMFHKGDVQSADHRKVTALCAQNSTIVELNDSGTAIRRRQDATIIATSTKMLWPLASTKVDLMASIPMSTRSADIGDFSRLRALGETSSDSKTPNATYLGAISCPDKSNVEAGGLLCKTWEFCNSGTEMWPAGTCIQHVSGHFVGTSHALNIDTLPEPGEKVEVTLSLKTPVAHGRHIGYFQLTAPDGERFGHKVWIDVMLQADMSTKEKQIYDMGFFDLEAIRVALSVEGGDVEKAVSCLVGVQ